LHPSDKPPIVPDVEPPRLVTPPLTIDFALMGPTVVDSARLRERHVLPVVVDTNVLIEDALYRVAHLVPTIRSSDRQVVLHPAPSALSHLMSINAVRVYGKPDLLDEVAEHLPRVAARKGSDAEAALALITTDYAPHIRFVDPKGILIPDSEADFAEVARIDPDDEPTARLSRLLDPSILLTLDRKALLRFGFGQWVDDPDMDAVVRRPWGHDHRQRRRRWSTQSDLTGSRQPPPDRPASWWGSPVVLDDA
jgi:hypothetical protein